MTEIWRFRTLPESRELRKNVHSPNSRIEPCIELLPFKKIDQQHQNSHIKTPKGTNCTARSTQAQQICKFCNHPSVTIQDPEYYKDLEACWDLAISLRTAPTTAACSRHSDLFKASKRLMHVVTLTLHPL